MERNYDDRQKSQQDRNRQPEQQGNLNQSGGAQGSVADINKRGRAGLPETEADRQRNDRHRSEF